MDPTHVDIKNTIMEAIWIEVTGILEERVVTMMPMHGPTPSSLSVFCTVGLLWF
jgi:hypothetical protein